MTDIQCPACGSVARHYTLNDQRLQCAVCRKKFTVGRHAGTLPPPTLRLVAEEFWRMTPASAAAAELGMNSKTVQKYYDVLRRAITEAGEGYAVAQFGTATIDPAPFHDNAARRGLAGDAQPLFCLAQGKDRVSLLRAGRGETGDTADTVLPALLGWVYARDRRALSDLDLDRTHFLATDATRGTAAAATFWPAARKGLVRYHGGFRKNFYLFVREMEFRFNARDETAAIAQLMEILHRDRNSHDRR